MPTATIFLLSIHPARQIIQNNGILCDKCADDLPIRQYQLLQTFIAMLVCRRVSSNRASMGSSALPILHALKNKGSFSRIWYIQPSKGTHRRIGLMNLRIMWRPRELFIYESIIIHPTIPYLPESPFSWFFPTHFLWLTPINLGSALFNCTI